MRECLDATGATQTSVTLAVKIMRAPIRHLRDVCARKALTAPEAGGGAQAGLCLQAKTPAPKVAITTPPQSPNPIVSLPRSTTTFLPGQSSTITGLATRPDLAIQTPNES